MVISQTDVSALLAGCVDGDDVARAEFITLYSPFIEKSVALKLTALTAPRPALRGDVEDIRNDILERLLRNDCAVLATVRDADRIDAWLMTLCRNHTVDYVRKHAARMRAVEIQEEHEALSAPDAPRVTAMENERAQILSRELQALPGKDRLVITLYYVHGLRYAEIAEITSQNINTVAAQIRRAKAKLRNLLEHVYDEL